ncbi:MULTISPECIES: hypothetical protein [Streptomyces]|uniref:Secreted protein n=1 Tax=Streptomyces lichenis TaxID=2306967 RepID=A0ABT0IH82_9ACTN|nr:hypothetical protein [Streptomyces lichenis]MCK8680612.1 hypothetical protein [Streptomyces lichenis]
MERLAAVEDVVARLRGELGEVGVVLPSLRVDPVTAIGEAVEPLVDLGRCNLETATRLVEALRGGRG